MNLKKIILCASVAAMAAAFAVSHAGAATAEEKAEKRRLLLEKYDTNKDGKINREERAAKKADDDAEKARQKAERDAKKKAKAEKEP